MLMLDELDASRIKTDSIAFNAVISTCEKASDWQRGLSILDLMTSRSIEASVVTYNSAMSACGKAEKSQVVLELLRHLEDSSMLVDVVSYNVAMSALGLAGRWRRALRMLAAPLPANPAPALCRLLRSSGLCLRHCSKVEAKSAALHRGKQPVLVNSHHSQCCFERMRPCATVELVFVAS